MFFTTVNTIAMYKVLLTAFGAGISFMATAQIMIRGSVVDAQSRQPLAYALIHKKDNDNTNAESDHYGNFSLRVCDKNALNL